MKYNARNVMNKRALRNLGLCNSETMRVYKLILTFSVSVLWEQLF